MTDGSAPVLLVEDDDAFRQILVRALRAHGFQVAEASSVENAVDALHAGLRPRLVLLDLNLPDANGWDFLRRPDLAEAGSPPVVITSASAVGARVPAELDIAAYLVKPFALEALMATIERLLG